MVLVNKTPSGPGKPSLSALQIFLGNQPSRLLFSRIIQLGGCCIPFRNWFGTIKNRHMPHTHD